MAWTSRALGAAALGVIAVYLSAWTHLAVREGANVGNIRVVDERAWPSPPPAGWPERPREVTAWSGPDGMGVLAWTDSQWAEQVLVSPAYRMEYQAYGWFVPVVGRRDVGAGSQNVWASSDDPRIAPGWLVSRFPALRSIPLRPRWPAFAVLWSLCSAALLLATPALRWMQRWRRRRRGRCELCGYDLRASLACPECGGVESPRPWRHPGTLAAGGLVVLGGLVIVVYWRGMRYWAQFVRDQVAPSGWSQAAVTGSIAAGERVRGALLAYRADHGVFPEELESLVPTYLPEIPDPQTGHAHWLYEVSRGGTSCGLRFAGSPRQFPVGSNYDGNSGWYVEGLRWGALPPE